VEPRAKPGDKAFNAPKAREYGRQNELSQSRDSSDKLDESVPRTDVRGFTLASSSMTENRLNLYFLGKADMRNLKKGLCNCLTDRIHLKTD
jgi:hypothetical protein